MKLFISVLFFSVCVYPQVEDKHPFITTGDLKAVAFFDENTGWIAEDGVILKTEDGGKKWVKYYLDHNSHYQDINVVTKDTLFLHSSLQDYRTFKTIDGGKTWNEIIFSEGIKPFTSYFLNSSKGFFLSREYVLMTTDGGGSWDTLFHSLYNGYLPSISFIDDNMGWLSFDNLYKTSDGGISWNMISEERRPAIKFLTPLLGYTSAFDIKRTTDGGLSWQTVSYLRNNWSASIIDSLNFYRYGGWPNCGTSECPGVDKTTDGGNTWVTIYNHKRYGIRSAFFLNDSTGYFTGSDGLIAKVTGGTTVSFLNGNYIFDAAAKESSVILAGEYGHIYKSHNYGNDWEKSESGTSQHIRRVVFMNDDIAVAFTDSLVLRSSDRGETWEQVSDEIHRITEYHMMNEKEIYVSTLPGPFFKSEDGGLTWVKYNSPDSLYSIFFLNNNIGYISGRKALYKTTDGGMNWLLLNSSDYPKRNLVFFDELSGYCSVEGIFKTSDGGITWQEHGIIYDPTADVQYYGKENYYLLTRKYSFSKMLDHTDFEKQEFKFSIVKNGIGTLITKDYGYSKPLLDFPDNNYGWIAAGRKILRITLDQVTSSDPDYFPEDYTLSQNYPNPFNPSTKINYSLPNPGYVKIILYNQLGEVTAVLLNEFRGAGNYILEFNAGSLPSGIYFYKMTINDFSAVKKLILLK
jgi:photosystem II stability/assembly factor-like uncharacterized protein